MARRSNKKLRTRFSKKTILIVLATLIAVAAIAYVINNHQNSKYTSPQTISNTSGKSQVNLSPPTPQEKADTEAHKQSLENPPAAPPTTSGGKKQVTPVITSNNGSTSYKASAYVTGVFEEGGICTATATKGSATVTGNSIGIENSNYTTCPPISLNLSPGTWALSVSYSSAKAEGKSEAKNIVIN
jgi:cytoskeletal protein RodZ